VGTYQISLHSVTRTEVDSIVSVSGDQIAGSGRGATNQVVVQLRRALNINAMNAVRDGGGSARVRADEVSLDRIVGAAQNESGKGVARNDVRGAGGGPANHVVARVAHLNTIQFFARRGPRGVRAYVFSLKGFSAINGQENPGVVAESADRKTANS